MVLNHRPSLCFYSASVDYPISDNCCLSPSDSFFASAPLASIQRDPQTVRFPRKSSNGTPSFSMGTGTTDTNGSLEVAFPTSYGRYRAEDLELENDRLKAIHEEGEENENVKVERVC